MDAVKKPAHYNQGPIECIDAMKIVLTPEEFRGYLKGNVFKYIWREKDKNGIEDLRKGMEYYDRLIQLSDASEPEQPKTPRNSDNIPEGYRNLGDSSGEPRQLGDLRWSVSEKRYIEISVDEIGYANRDNWAACRKITGEVNGEVTGEVEPPDGWRWLKVGEVIRKGDRWWYKNEWNDRVGMIGVKFNEDHIVTIRRNKFEVGEKVVHVDDKEPIAYVVEGVRGDGAVLSSCRNIEYALNPNKLAPYIEDQS